MYNYVLSTIHRHIKGESHNKSTKLNIMYYEIVVFTYYRIIHYIRYHAISHFREISHLTSYSIHITQPI